LSRAEVVMSAPAISVVVPVFNEEGNVADLYARTRRVLQALALSYEFVFIDDGSTDGTGDMLRALAANDPHVKIIALSRNFNQHCSIAAGFAYARGNKIVLMDADLQDVPEELPKLLQKADQGYDIVYALRENRSDSLYRKLLARSFFVVFRFFSGIALPEGISTYRVVSRRFANAFNQLNDHNRFTAGLMAWLGFTVASVPVQHDARKHGTSKYTMGKLLRLSFDAVISFSDSPLKLASKCGMSLSFLSVVAGLYMLFRKLTVGFDMIGYASLIVAILFLSGVQLFFIGLLGEYLSRIYAEVQGRPLYVVKETINLERHAQALAPSTQVVPANAAGFQRN
jgi:dolichol-phosphate mannosyltransferase